MASVDVEIAARRYAVACRDGEEEQLRALAAIVDGKAQDAAAAVGSLSEVRQLLFAALLLADEVKEHRSGRPPAPEPPAQPAAAPDPAVAEALETLAGRLESLATSLEQRAQAS